MEMKELNKKVYHSKWYDIDINEYLTYSQIEQIIESVMKFDSWAEREQNIDMLLLYHATNLTKEELENTGHDMLVQSGLVEEVRKTVRNFYSVYEGLQYTQSLQRAMVQIVEKLPELTKPLTQVMEKYGTKK